MYNHSENSTIEGKVTDLKESLAFSTVALYQNGVVVKGVETDMDGNYFLSGIKPGTYDMEASYVGYAAHRQTGIILKSGTNRVNFKLSDSAILLDFGELRSRRRKFRL
ncbi:MAG: carboxypeptidase-like regulatory domain-containing protein [Saprospiraceae bacterium]|nr:carboxypeptidase-like regulatory domain-containing protein [Saprospiraceae bacterium]